MQQFIGIDVGGTKIAAGAFVPGGALRAEQRRETPSTSIELVPTIISLVRELSTDAQTVSVGVGIPGNVSEDGHVTNAVNVGIGAEGLALQAELEAALGVPVRVENDVKAAALGASALNGTTDETLVYLSIGTGMAAGIVQHGEIVRGASGAVGEVGHFPFDPAGPACGCGQHGCIETYASGSAIKRSWNDPLSPNALALVEASDSGQVSAIHTYRRLIAGLAAAVRLLALSQDPQTIILGGGVTIIGDRLMDDLRAALVETGDRSPFLKSLGLEHRIHLQDPTLPVATFGAALLAHPTPSHLEALTPQLAA